MGWSFPRSRMQYNLGNMYANGEGVAEDYAQAHMWNNLFAARSNGEARENAVELPDLIADGLTPDALNAVERLAREWDAAHPRKP
jgi:TPR repeat protein